MGRFLPGAPKIQVRNMPGAGGLIAARHLVEDAPADGSILALAGANPFFASLDPATSLQRAYRKIAYVGARARETFLCFAWRNSVLRNFDDARAHAVFAGTLGAGSRGQAHLMALNELAGTRFRIVAGYSNTYDVSRSLENGEIEAACGYTMNLLQARHGDWLREGKIRLLARFGLVPYAWKTRVPSAGEEALNSFGREVMEILAIEGDLVWGADRPAGHASRPPGAIARGVRRHVRRRGRCCRGRSRRLRRRTDRRGRSAGGARTDLSLAGCCFEAGANAS